LKAFGQETSDANMQWQTTTFAFAGMAGMAKAETSDSGYWPMLQHRIRVFSYGAQLGELPGRQLS